MIGYRHDAKATLNVRRYLESGEQFHLTSTFAVQSDEIGGTSDKLVIDQVCQSAGGRVLGKVRFGREYAERYRCDPPSDELVVARVPHPNDEIKIT
jgi:hypothetical protein